jgi:NDP-sugar pyrophosphorylase family protein
VAVTAVRERAAMVLAAGLGTRLRPLTDERAKPLVPVGDRPVLGHILDRLGAARVARIAVNAHHRADDVRSFLPPGVALSVETELLGTAGGLERALPHLGAGDVLVWNGDILTELDVDALYAAHSTDATLAVAPRGDRLGNVGLDAHGDVVRLRKETVRPGEVRSADFLAVHLVGASLRRRLPKRGDFISDVYLPAMRDGARLRSVEHAGAWFDVGSLAVYLAANRAWLSQRGLAAWSAPSARVSASIDGSVIGPHAVVEAPALRSVVWPYARVTEPIEDAVVTPRGIVRST